MEVSGRAVATKCIFFSGGLKFISYMELVARLWNFNRREGVC